MMSAEIRDQRAEVSARQPWAPRLAAHSPATLAASHHAQHASRPRAGFSLVEMMVVVGIVVLLFALTIGVLTVLSRSAESRTTKDALSILDQAYEEWKRTSERDVTYGIDGVPQAGMTYEVEELLPSTPPGTGDDHLPTDELIDIIHRSAPIRDILSKINPDLLIKHPPPEDDLTLQDAWDTEVITVHPGRSWNGALDAAALKDPVNDGTIRTEFENAFGFCTNRRLRFVSAGPDGQFGDLRAANGTPDREAAKDNIYSYPLEATP